MVKATEDKYKFGTGQLFNFAPNSYLERTSRPIYAIVFLLPFIIVYELGTIFINTDVLNQSQIRVVAFIWLQNFLEYIGFSSKMVWITAPLAVILILLGLQMASRKKWSFWLADFFPMTIECVFLSIPLIVLTLFMNSNVCQNDMSFFQRNTTQTLHVCAAVESETSQPTAELKNNEKKDSPLANIVTGIGAGIYEELVFRLILICILMVFFQDLLKLRHQTSIIFSVLISAALFSAHHHWFFTSGVYHGLPFDWTAFSFRTIAGIYFAILFAIRGFGITAGTHAFYDILAIFINVFFFKS